MADSFSLPICPPLLLAQSHRYQFETEAEDDAYAQRGKILLRKERENQAAGLPVGEYKPKEAPPAEKKAWFGRDAAPTPATPPKEKEKGVYAKMKESGYRPGAVSSAREAAKASASGREREALRGGGSGAHSGSGGGGLLGGLLGGTKGGGGGSGGGGGGSGSSALDSIFSSLKSKNSDAEDEEMATELLPRRKR